MYRDFFRKKCDEIITESDTRLEAIAQWDELTPKFKQLADVARTLRDGLEQGPAALDAVSYEPLANELTLVADDIRSLPIIPLPSTSTGPILTASVSGTAYAVHGYVSYVTSSQPEEPAVSYWGQGMRTRWDTFIAKEKDTEEVERRLALLSSKLSELYRLAVDSTTKCAAGLRTASDAANCQRNVLEKFKGRLVELCKPRQASKVQHYDLISQCLAANSAITRKSVTDGHEEYTKLHDSLELTGITKGDRAATGEDMQRLLERINRHILTITDALDPAKTGVRF